MNTQRYALVTGGAKRIGAAIVRRLHLDGWHLLIHCQHSQREAELLANTLNLSRAGSARVLAVDLADANGHERLAAAIETANLPLGLLVNNASVFIKDDSLCQLSAANSLMQVNCVAPYLLARRLAPVLALNRGAVINLCDIYGQRPLKNHGLYSMSKAALIMATSVLAQELAPGIRVNGVSPGAILWPEIETCNTTKVISEIPLGRAGETSDVADTVAFLANAGYITGQIIAVDGGRSAVGFRGAAV